LLDAKVAHASIEAHTITPIAIGLRDFLSPHRKNAEVDSRIQELSTFRDIDRRAVKMMQSREVAVSA
jgi:hypothetical protein